MSCATQTQQPVRFIVQMGSLPEGFCGTPQQLADAIAERLLITPDQIFSSFVTGSVPPTSNVGPWLKDCLRWFVFDDSTGTYIPTLKGGFDTQQFFSSSGNFTVPEFIYKLRVSLWGGGGGGATGSGGTYGGGGGGSGGFCLGILNVTPGQNIPFTVGVGGTVGAPATDGSDSTFLTMLAGGGKGSPVNGTPGIGGTANGGDMNIPGQSGAQGYVADPGQGGSAPQGGPGGAPNDTVDAATKGTIPGGGGGGGYPTLSVAGDGANGGILIEW